MDRKLRSAVVSSLVLALGGVAVACVGDDPVTTTPGATSDGGQSDGPLTGEAGTSEGGMSDGGGPCVPGTKTCVDGTTLGTCGDPATQKCALDCSTVGGAHCTIMQPTAPVVPDDLTTVGAAALTINASALVDTDTGAIEGIRPPNGDPGALELKSGIAFRRIGNVGVFSVKSFTVNTGATLKLRGTSAFALAAAETITVVGIIDARGYDAAGVLCGTPNTTPASDTAYVAGPGGSPGGQRTGANNGSATGAGGGKGVAGFTSGSAGAGGGGFGGRGGNGGGYAISAGGSVAFPSPIAGGFGGGASGGSGGANGQSGGGGGGAVQLVAGISIEVGGGANPGGVNVGGCGGTGAMFGETGSAGGSGGAILLQAPSISMKALGVLAANGGAGSTGSTGTRAGHGTLSRSTALGSAAVSGYGKGGDGAPGNPPNTPLLDGENGGTGTKGGGGGGASGRIRLENRSGSIAVPADGIVSPPIATGATAAGTVGVLPVK